MQETIVFIDISSDCVQNKLLIHFFCRTIVETPEIFVFLDAFKVSFRLNGENLAVQYSFLTLDIPSRYNCITDIYIIYFILLFVNTI